MKQKVHYKKRILIKYWFIRHRILAMISVLLLALGGYGIAKHIEYGHKVAVERTQFAQAKTDLDDLYDQIVASVGQPLAHSSEQYCSRTSTEAFAGKGALSCDIVIQASFEQINLKNIVSFNINPIQYKSFISSNQTNDYITVYAVTNTIDTPACYVHLWSGIGDEYPYEFKAEYKDHSKKLYLLELGCGGGTLTNYYPLKQL